MEDTKEILKKQYYEPMRKRREFEKSRRAKKQRGPVQQVFRLFKGYTNLPHFITDAIIIDPDLTQREMKILLMIIRLTLGLQKRTVRLRNRDYEATGITETHTKRPLLALEEKEWISITNRNGQIYYALHKKRFLEVPKDNKLNRVVFKVMLQQKIIENGNEN